MVSQWKVVGYTDGRGRWAISRSEYHTRLEAWWLRGPLWLQLRGLLLTNQLLTPRSVGPINFATVFWNWPRERTVKSLAGFQLLFLCRAAFCPYSPQCLVWSGLGAHTDICKGAPTAISNKCGHTLSGYRSEILKCLQTSQSWIDKCNLKCQ